METKTMLKLKTEVDMDGVVIRYKDFVIVAEFLTGPSGEWFATNVYRPIETEEETGEDFMNLRLENVTEWGGRRYGTEGEALRDGMDFIEWKF